MFPDNPWAENLLFRHKTVSDSLWPHGVQHARLLCLLSPIVCSNSCPLSQWGYLTISFSAAPFSFCFHSFSASGSFPMSWLFASGGQSMGTLASANSPSNTYSGLGIDWLDLLASQGTLKSLLQNHVSKASILRCSAFFYGPALTSIHDYWKNHSFDYMDLCQQSDISAF